MGRQGEEKMRKLIHDFKVEYLQVLNEDGSVDKKEMPKLSAKQIKELYEMMVLVRTFDEKALVLQRQGRIGSYLQVKGQEASQVGSVYALKDKDWMFPMYRSSGALIARKQPIEVIYQYWGGDERGHISPKEVNNFPMTIPVGTQIAHASGAAWASVIKGSKEVSLVFFGDGATSKSEFHTGLNFAGVYNAPCIFVCENNQFAISTPREKQTHAQTIAQKAIAYGMRGIQVDGNDIFAVYSAVSKAVEDARKGKGPALVECLTYRMADHSTSDDAKKYRKEADVKRWLKKDPVLRLEKYMKKAGLLTEAYKKKVEKDAKQKIEKAVEKYEAAAPAKKDDMFTYMFEEMPEQLKDQYEGFKGGE